MSPLAPWYWRSLPLQNRTASQLFAALFQGDDIAVLLESPPGIPQTHARYSLCAGSPRPGQSWTPSLGNVLPTLRQRLTTPSPDATPSHLQHLPFLGGWLGWFGYELAWEIETLPPLAKDPIPFPVAFWYEPAAFALLDHQADQLHLAASGGDRLDQLEQRLENFNEDGIKDHQKDQKNYPNRVYIPDSPISPTGMPAHITLSAGWQPDDYQKAVQQILGYIQAGDIFQGNLSVRFEHHGPVNPWQLYQTLQRINPSPFASYWQTPWGYIVSCSPERLVQVQGDTIQTRPIAGTRPRGRSPAEDQALAATLQANPKERAEHIMLVDLERNDLGRVCTWGTVTVDELLTLEYYSHVIHLVSNVRGQRAGQWDGIDVIGAVFPGGTITGCPKVRCMEILAGLEPFPRNLFYGSCGYLDQRGYLDLNILIRTLLVRGDRQLTWGQVGAGIVADSDPQREWQESLDKAQALFQAIPV
ncbi:anthranilate synthase component I [Candidatus Synechococcus calcipolaris G9]|uniref:Anthranilate synthase component 1 n=1 Tax=Candidatus Synechococcus calcipolaris G9 TaxID=1497997 RepID=A0ABT6F068_9SYNE|nr:anthranilate synthase component I [Candidatus Synechococcus calcipolaris]MDG2991264.1 anthranilate synthase component I [Candidatus Synechococcus calcipolaris G9]